MEVYLNHPRKKPHSKNRYVILLEFYCTYFTSSSSLLSSSSSSSLFCSTECNEVIQNLCTLNLSDMMQRAASPSCLCRIYCIVCKPVCHIFTRIRLEAWGYWVIVYGFGSGNKINLIVMYLQICCFSFYTVLL
jgi:hypothetical protein